MPRVPVKARGQSLAALGASAAALVQIVINEFCSRWTPGGELIYVSDSMKTSAHLDEQLLTSLRVAIDPHGKMPDVVVYDERKSRLVLIEAVTSHGPVNPKRMIELRKLFEGSKAGLVFVTAFIDRRAMLKYLDEISWETEVWVAESPDHLIHFNGERFLGPYPVADK